MRAADLQDASVKGDYYLIEEMKKTMSDSMPESLEGEVTEDWIVKKFKEFYGALYSSCPSKGAMSILKDKLSGLVTADSLAEVQKVTSDVVKNACMRMKPCKTDVSEAYSSDV